MKTHEVIFRFLFVLLTVAILADAVVVLASFLKEAKEEYFMLWQWESLGWIFAVSQTFTMWLAYVAVGIVSFRPIPDSSPRKANITAFIIVLASTYSVVVLWRIADSLFHLQRVFEAYAHVFMAAHLAAAAGLATLFIAVNKEKEEEKNGGHKPPRVFLRNYSRRPED